MINCIAIYMFMLLFQSSQPTPGGSFQQQSSGFGGNSSYQQFGGPSLYNQYGGAGGQQQGYGGMPPGQPGKQITLQCAKLRHCISSSLYIVFSHQSVCL